MATKNGDLLPEDVMIEILSWLPVKTLLQFRCVCKSWNEIIVTSDFISKHLNNYYNNSNNGCLLAYHGGIFYPESQWCGLFPDETLEDLSHQTLDLPFPQSLIYGPSNGLFYVESDFVPGDCGLWNPATKEFMLLPAKLTKSNLPPGVTYSFDVSGFGLDPVTNDYKVVVIRYLESIERMNTYLPSQVIVYTLGTDSWRYWGDLPSVYFLNRNTCYTYMKGIYYWLGYYEGNRPKDRKLSYSEMPKVIISFDMATDEFQEIPVPEEIQRPDPDSPDFDIPTTTFERLALYHDSIALFIVDQVEKFLDIWVLNDGGWVKKFSFVSFMGIRDPIGYWKNDKLFLEFDADELMLVDPSTREIKHIIQRGRFFDGAFIYKDSLVSILNRNKYRQNEKYLTECE